MPLILIGIIILLVFGAAAAFWITGHVLGLALHLLMAGLVGGLADAVIPGKLPYGWLGAVAAGLVGSWLGSLVLGSIGPSLFGVSLVPAFAGAAVLAVGAEVLGRAGRRNVK